MPMVISLFVAIPSYSTTVSIVSIAIQIPVDKVVDTFWRLDKEGDADETSKNDQVVVENMILLQSRGISSVDCGKRNKILICPGVDDMMGKCQLIEVIRAQANNAD
eukprot:scaffold382131_cov89-Attheya_sp.AAC.2